MHYLARFKIRRVVSCAAICAVLVIAVQAVASSRDYEGGFPASPGASMSYQVSTHHAGSEVRRFKVDKVPMSCTGSSGTITSSFPKVMKMDGHNKFAGSKHVVNEDVGIDYVEKVSGTAGKQSGHGTYQFKGDTGPTTHNCDTGKASWEAEKAP